MPTNRSNLTDRLWVALTRYNLLPLMRNSNSELEIKFNSLHVHFRRVICPLDVIFILCLFLLILDWNFSNRISFLNFNLSATPKTLWV